MLKKAVVVIGLAVLVAAGAQAAGGPDAAKPVTIGDFLAKVAVASGSKAGDARISSDARKSPGASAEFDAAAPLTFGVAARIAADLGVTVAVPADPSGLVSAAQAGLIASYIGANSAEPGLSTLSVPPDQCLSSANRGACVDCCKTATGLTGKYCGKYCHANVPPPPSPGEPQP